MALVELLKSIMVPVAEVTWILDNFDASRSLVEKFPNLATGRSGLSLVELEGTGFSSAKILAVKQSCLQASKLQMEQAVLVLR